jgi:hypothetical protein
LANFGSNYCYLGLLTLIVKKNAHFAGTNAIIFKIFSRAKNGNLDSNYVLLLRHSMWSLIRNKETQLFWTRKLSCD